jgi:hypothetical protein
MNTHHTDSDTETNYPDHRFQLMHAVGHVDEDVQHLVATIHRTDGGGFGPATMFAVPVGFLEPGSYTIDALIDWGSLRARARERLMTEVGESRSDPGGDEDLSRALIRAAWKTLYFYHVCYFHLTPPASG